MDVIGCPTQKNRRNCDCEDTQDARAKGSGSNVVINSAKGFSRTEIVNLLFIGRMMNYTLL